MDQLDEQEFTLLLIYFVLDVMRIHICSYASPTREAWLLAHPNTPSFRSS